MMVLEKVGADHHSLASRYISEPILAEVAAEATGNYGWGMALRTLVSELRSGVVMKSFRGEFLTRILVIIAMEDAQRRKRKENKNENKEQNIVANPTFLIEGQSLNPTAPWDFSQVVPVAYFLDALLQHPRQDLPPNLHRNKKQRLDDAHDQSSEHDPDNHLFSQFLLDEIQSKEIEPLERKRDKAMDDFEIKNAANSKARTTVAGDAKRLLEEAEGNLKAAKDKLEKGRKHSDTTQAMATKFLNRGRVFFNH
jgi:DNA gyrase/topoisomerase IV subunit A